MSSTSREKFVAAVSDADLLCLRGISEISRRQRKVQYHAALAALVAAWEFYLESLVREFLVEVADPLNLRFAAIQALYRGKVELELKKFNTPNAENSRNLVFGCTGYDPINDWSWSARGMNGIAVRGLINEVIQVRHSFAHGFAMPAYSWNTSSAGAVRLTAASLQTVSRLFSQVVSVTDKGLDGHIKIAFQRSSVWY